MPLLGGERQEVTSPALERIPAQEKTGIWNLIKSISSLLSTRPPPLPSGDPLEQLVRHFLIETGPKGVKIKGCPSEPYFGEAQGPRGLRRVEGELGRGRHLWAPQGFCHLPLQAACRPWCPSTPSPHCPCPAACASPAKVGACDLPSRLSSPAAAQGGVPRSWLPACLPLGQQSCPAPRERDSLLTFPVGPHCPQIL